MPLTTPPVVADCSESGMRIDSIRVLEHIGSTGDRAAAAAVPDDTRRTGVIPPQRTASADTERAVDEPARSVREFRPRTDQRGAHIDRQAGCHAAI